MQITIDTVKDSHDDIQLVIELLESVIFRSEITGPASDLSLGTDGKISLGLHPITTVTLTDTVDEIDDLFDRSEHPPERLVEQPDPLPTIEQVIPHLAANKLGGVHFTAHNQIDTGVSQELPGDAAGSVNRLPATPTLAVDEDTDTAGQKWDATLHSESRAKVADGTWRKRRTAKNVVVPIKPAVTFSTDGVERFSVMVATEVPPPPVVVPPPPTMVSPPPSADSQPAAPIVAASEPVAQIVPPPPVAATVVPPPPSEAFVPVTVWKALMAIVAKLMATREITSKDVAAVCVEHGIDSLQACFDNTALIPSVHTALHKIATKVA